MTTPDCRFCDERGEHGFGWIVDESMTRTSHALVVDGKVWLVDPVDWPEAIDRVLMLGEPAGVLQLVDRHNRDCAAIADRLGIPRLVAPDEVPGSPFRCVPVGAGGGGPRRRSGGRRSAPSSSPRRWARTGSSRPGEHRSASTCSCG